MRCDIIYTCGDSHTAGGETADDLIWPAQHPGFHRESELALRDMRTIRRWREFRERSLRRGDPVGYAEWQERERAEAWPAHLAYALGCQLENGARIGSSMEWIARQTITDVNHLLLSHEAADVYAIVQPSTHLRLQLHDLDKGGWTSMQMADAYGLDPHVHQWLNTHETELSLITRWVMAVLGMLGHLQQRGVRCLLVNSGQLGAMDLSLLPPGLRQAHDCIITPAWHARSMSDAAIAVDLCRCPDLHWTREVHAAFGLDLARSLA